MPVGMTGSQMEILYSGTESATWLDGPAELLGRQLSRLADTPVGAVLHGTPVGHPLHPALVTVPIGAWTAAVAFDALRQPEAARRLIGLGLLATPPTVLAGWVDWVHTDTVQRRVGLIHAVVNGTGAALMALSYRRRRRGRTPGAVTLNAPGAVTLNAPGAVALSAAGAALIGLGGLLGGHLAYSLGANVRPAEVPNAPAYDPVLAGSPDGTA
ncbi:MULTISPECIES: DUF2231 domain-containing protein [Rhodococcus]|uniref:DUF2231 domain-containing protein n=1 Tax=Rhodococcus TaxID=1827 RepID=UPI0009EDC289|nr:MULTISPECIES: DUF2231 domain-containing protein [Rhodococcus]AWH00293.1 hypothetical protein DCN13_17915 [Rhodococcus ruber]MCZ1071018.1 hypothetical protein [Rhodococcus sp. A5(2022)]